jgi:hypothetical protein
MSLDYKEDENEAFLPPRRVFSFDEWNEPPNTHTTPQFFSFDEWTEPGDHDEDHDDSNHDDQDHDHHSYTTPPNQTSILKEASTRHVSTYSYNTSTVRRGILKHLVPLDTTQSEGSGGDSDKTTPHHCRGIPRCSSRAHNKNDEEFATILVDIQGFWPLGITIEFEKKKDNVLEEDDDDYDVSTIAESVTEIPPQRMQEQWMLDESPLRPRRLALGRHRLVRQRLVQLVPWNCTSWTGKVQVNSNRLYAF